jgi:hypothetical protein
MIHSTLPRFSLFGSALLTGSVLLAGCVTEPPSAPFDGDESYASGGSGGETGGAGGAGGGDTSGGAGGVGGDIGSGGVGGEVGNGLDETGLVARYQFDDGPGSTIVKDTSGVAPALDLQIANPEAVQWLDGALDVVAPTIIQSNGPATKIYDACKATNELSVLTWVTPADLEQGGPARMITLSVDPGTRNFTLGQVETQQFVFRLRSELSDNQGLPALLTPVEDTVVTTQLTHVAFTRSAEGLRYLYVNGVMSTQDDLGGGFDNWSADYAFALANELTQDRPFLGAFHHVDVYCRELSEAEVLARHALGSDP